MTQRTTVYLSITLFFATLLWGAYTFLIYLGIPVHQLVYLTREQISTIDATCSGDLLCRGFSVLTSFFASLVLMASPFWTYIIVSISVYIGILAWNGYHTGSFSLRCTFRPVYFVFFFCLSVWLIGTTLSMGSLFNAQTPDRERISDTMNGKKILMPFNYFFEPTQEMYGDIGPEGMQELRSNFDALNAAGCLEKDPLRQHLYQLHFLCMQQSMFARIGLQILMVSLFLLNLLVIGRSLLRVFRCTNYHPLLILCLSFGVGALGLIAILWTLGIFGLLQATMIQVLLLGLPLVLFPQTMWWAKAAWNKSIEVDVSWKDMLPVLLWLLISYLALNFINVVRPFPIGWDDLGSYLNRPRLLASYGTFISSMSQFQWEYLTSLGFLFFGYDSWPGATFSMQINWAAGFLAVLTSYAFGRLYFGPKYGALTAMLYYFLPMTGHFSFADMKIDNAVYFASTIALLAACAVIFPPKKALDDTEGDEPTLSSYSLLFVAGILAGFAFGVKPTAILTILMIAAILMGYFFGPIGFAGMTVTNFGVLQYFGPLTVSSVLQRIVGHPITGQYLSSIPLITLFAGILILLIAMNYKRTMVQTAFYASIIFCAGVVLSIAPWMLHNGVIAGHFSLGNMLSAQDYVSPQIFYTQQKDVEAMHLPSTIPVRYLPPELALDIHHPFCGGSARTEELDRYWGFEHGLSHYLTLPWRQVMNIDGFGYYVTFMPALLLFPLLLLLPFFWRRQGRVLRLLFAGTCFFLVQWMLVGNGIAWYGIGMFLGFALALESFIAYAPDTLNRVLFALLITGSIFVCLINRLWQFDTQKNILEYPLGKISAGALQEQTIANYDDIRQSVVTRHETLKDAPFTYRIGTFISYFIPRNREIFPLADHQLTFFNCINQERDHALTLRRLKALGFNSMIFDTNTQTIEKDPNGTLHQKVNAFKAFAEDPAIQLQFEVNDPGSGIVYLLLP